MFNELLKLSTCTLGRPVQGASDALPPPRLQHHSNAAALHFDVAIMGAGMAGASLAAALSANPITRSLRVALVDPRPQVTLRQTLPEHADCRVSVLTPASIQLLRAVGAWRSLAPAAAPFCDMQVWGSGGTGFVRCSAASIGSSIMACVVETRLAEASLLQRLRVAAPGVQLMMPAAPAGVELPPYSPVAQLDGGSLVRVHLQGGTSMQARLLVGADGRGSLVQQWAMIRSLGDDPGEQHTRLVELAATVATARPLQTAFQRFLPTGPLALLPARTGGVALWTCPPQMAARLRALSRHELASAITDVLTAPPYPPASPPLSSLLGGILEPEGRRRFVDPPAVVDVVHGPELLPLSLHHAGRYTRPRVALIGDAAHGVHAMAGQGDNLGLADAAALARTIAGAVEAGQDIGSAAHLEQRYEQPQWRANAAMIAAADGLRCAFRPQAGPMAALGRLGLDVVNSAPVLKQTMMRLAMYGMGS